MLLDSGRRRKTGLVLRELTTVVLTFAVSAIIIVILMQGFNGRGPGAKPIKDADQLRDIHRAMIVWSQQNGDRYPPPSELDRDDATVRVDGDATLKDSTGALFSVLIFNDLVTPDDFYSPAEPNAAMYVPYDTDFTEAALAVDPANARWDPSFRGTPLDPLPAGSGAAETGGHNSYAHLALAGRGRLRNWTSLADPGTPIVGTRGPKEVRGVWGPGRGAIQSTTLDEGPLGSESWCLYMFGPKDVWQGNIAYNDNHVVMEKTTHPEGLRYMAIYDDPPQFGSVARTYGDGLFLDEGDPQVLSYNVGTDTRGVNALLGLFSRGPTEVERREHKEGVEYIQQARWFDGMESAP